MSINNSFNKNNTSFGMLFTFIFFIISIYQFTDNNLYLAFFFLILSALLLLFSLVSPQSIQPLAYLWYKLGLYLGLLISPIIIFLIYVLVLFPTFVFIKLTNFSTIKLKFYKKNKSEWIDVSKNSIEFDEQF